MEKKLQAIGQLTILLEILKSYPSASDGDRSYIKDMYDERHALSERMIHDFIDQAEGRELKDRLQEMLAGRRLVKSDAVSADSPSHTPSLNDTHPAVYSVGHPGTAKDPRPGAPNVVSFDALDVGEQEKDKNDSAGMGFGGHVPPGPAAAGQVSGGLSAGQMNPASGQVSGGLSAGQMDPASGQVSGGPPASQGPVNPASGQASIVASPPDTSTKASWRRSWPGTAPIPSPIPEESTDPLDAVGDQKVSVRRANSTNAASIASNDTKQDSISQKSEPGHHVSFEMPKSLNSQKTKIGFARFGSKVVAALKGEKVSRPRHAKGFLSRTDSQYTASGRHSLDEGPLATFHTPIANQARTSAAQDLDTPSPLTRTNTVHFSSRGNFIQTSTRPILKPSPSRRSSISGPTSHTALTGQLYPWKVTDQVTDQERPLDAAYDMGTPTGLDTSNSNGQHTLTRTVSAGDMSLRDPVPGAAAALAYEKSTPTMPLDSSKSSTYYPPLAANARETPYLRHTASALYTVAHANPREPDATDDETPEYAHSRTEPNSPPDTPKDMPAPSSIGAASPLQPAGAESNAPSSRSPSSIYSQDPQALQNASRISNASSASLESDKTITTVPITKVTPPEDPGPVHQDDARVHDGYVRAPGAYIAKKQGPSILSQETLHETHGNEDPYRPRLARTLSSESIESEDSVPSSYDVSPTVLGIDKADQDLQMSLRKIASAINAARHGARHVKNADSTKHTRKAHRLSEYNYYIHAQPQPITLGYPLVVLVLIIILTILISRAIP